jgi:hypothetical protein
MGTEGLVHGVQFVAGGQVGVAHRHGERPLAHEILHGADVDATHDEPRREGVAEVI